MNPPVSSSASWQVILADLSLILFVTTLAALAATQHQRGAEPALIPASGSEAAGAHGQALYRRRGNVVALGAWLDDRIRDPRERLTIFARYRPASRDAIWREAQQMESEAVAAGYAPRLILEGAVEDDIVASLAFDAAGTP
ncbi:MAG: hypothetical protein AB7G24_08405 [Novosphingobium sp.]